MRSLKVIQNKREGVILFEKYSFSAMVLSRIIAENEDMPQVVKDSSVLIDMLAKNTPEILFYEWDYGKFNEREVLKKIKTNFPNLKIILVHHVAQEINMSELESEYGIKFAVQRPFSRREVVKVLGSVRAN